MKRIAIAFLIVLAVFSVVFTGCSKKEAETKVVTIASDCTWPPMEFINDKKEIIGFDIDLIKAVAKAAEFEVVIQNTGWDGIFAGLANDSYDAVISSVTITDERKGTMDFSIPYINAGQVLIVPVSASGVSTLADLSGKNVGAQIGTTGAFEVEKVAGLTLKTYDELGLAIEDLANGNLAGVVADTPIAADFVMNNDAYKAKLKIVGNPFTEEYYGIAVKKGNTEVMNLLNKGLEAVIKSGERDELVAKWLR